MPNRTVSIVIKAKDAASRGIDGVKGKLSGIISVAKRAALGLAAVGTAAGAATVAFVKLASRGGQVLNVQRAFARVTGDSAEALRTLRQATSGLLNDFELMQGFNKAVALGSARNAQEFGELARTAITLGRALGVDVGYALESLNVGIGRQSRLFLDNLGLIIDVDRAHRAYAESLDKTVGQLTVAEQREAFRTAALEAARAKIQELGGVALNNADNITRIKNAVVNFRDRLAETVAQSPAVSQFFGAIEQGLQGILDRAPRAIELLSKIGTGALDLVGIGDPIQREAQRRIFALQGERGFGPDVARSRLQQVESDFAAALVRRSELERRANAQGLLNPDGSPSEAVTGPGNDPDAMRLIRDLEDVRREMEVMGQVARFLRTQLQAANTSTGGTPGLVLPPTRFTGLANTTGAPVQIGGRDVIGTGTGFTLRPGALPLEPLEMSKENAARLAARNLARENLMDGADAFDHAAGIAVGSLASMAAAAVAGTQQMETVVVSAFTNILQSLPGVGGIGAALIGGIGGIIGALFSRNDRDAMPVRVADYSDVALRKQKDVQTGPSVVIERIVSPDGELVSEARYELSRRERRDAVDRFPRPGR